MPYTTRFEPSACRGLLIADGPIDLAGSVEAMLTLAVDPQLEPGWTILVDLTSASYTPTIADAAKLMGLQQHTAALEGRRLAFVANTPAIQAVTGLIASMATAKGIPARAFVDAAEASRWLDEPGSPSSA